VTVVTGHEHHLEPYRTRLIDARHADLTRALLDWCAGRCTCVAGVAGHLRHVFESATFAYFCTTADTTAGETLLLAKDTVIFFLGDDGPTADLAALVGYLSASGDGGRGELTAWYRALVGELRAAGLDTDDYHAASRSTFAAMLAEQAVDPYHLTTAEYWAFRLSTIAGDPYIALWIALRHRRLEGAAARAWTELGLVRLANEAIILANDLGSLERDIAPERPAAGFDVNYALIPHPGLTTLDDRIELMIDLANRKADQIEHRLPLVEEAAVAVREPRLIEFGRFIAAYVTGNIEATNHLTHRYPAAGQRLGRLRRLDPDSGLAQPAECARECRRAPEAGRTPDGSWRVTNVTPGGLWANR
jgi:hypothetical protein